MGIACHQGRVLFCRRLALAAAVLAGCASRPPRGELAVAPPSGLPSVAIARVEGAGRVGGSVAEAFSRELKKSGVKVSVLERVDATLAAQAQRLRKRSDPGVLEEIRYATDARAVALLTLDLSHALVEVRVLDTRTGEVMAEGNGYPDGPEFRYTDEVGLAAAKVVRAARKLDVGPEPLSLRGQARKTEKGPAPWQAGRTVCSAGVIMGGGELAYHLQPETRLSLRYQQGSSGSGEERITATVAGLRAAHLLWAESATRPYFGLEADYIGLRNGGGGRAGSGGAVGVFAGAERRILGDLWFGVDAGEYAVFLRDSETGVSMNSLEFVVNVAATLYLF